MNGADRLSELIHDMRNQLAVARANIEAFIDGKLTPSAERLGSVLQSLDQLEELLKDLRASQGAVEVAVRPTEINVCELLDREYKTVEAVASEKKISFQVFRCPVKAEACVRFVGDPIRIGQIVTNVLLNAVRYTPCGGSIHVDCSRQAGQLEIAISDTGPGVSPEEAERIFEPGFRGSAASGTTGSGFGLAIVKELVEAQGGSVAVSSAAERGARFTVRLPGTVVSTGSLPVNCAPLELVGSDHDLWN
jgi:two-component system sensor histidine kinase BaeS